MNNDEKYDVILKYNKKCLNTIVNELSKDINEFSENICNLRDEIITEKNADFVFGATHIFMNLGENASKMEDEFRKKFKYILDHFENQ